MEPDNKAPSLAGREVQWKFDQDDYDYYRLKGHIPIEGRGIAHAFGFDSNDGSWKGFVVLVELSDGTLCSIPRRESNMRMVQKDSE